jgi:hypothetical protein
MRDLVSQTGNICTWKNTFFTYNFIKKAKNISCFYTQFRGDLEGRSVDLGQDAVFDLVTVARPCVSVFGLAPAVVSGHAVQKAQDAKNWHCPRKEMPKSCNKKTRTNNTFENKHLYSSFVPALRPIAIWQMMSPK